MNANQNHVCVVLELTPWRVSTPPGMRLRDWRSVSSAPAFRRTAAVVRVERPTPEFGARCSWNVWTPVSDTWPWRGHYAACVDDAIAAADQCLTQLLERMRRSERALALTCDCFAGDRHDCAFMREVDRVAQEVGEHACKCDCHAHMQDGRE